MIAGNYAGLGDATVWSSAQAEKSASKRAALLDRLLPFFGKNTRYLRDLGSLDV